jgi:hypothetical protein
MFQHLQIPETIQTKCNIQIKGAILNDTLFIHNNFKQGKINGSYHLNPILQNMLSSCYTFHSTLSVSINDGWNANEIHNGINSSKVGCNSLT